MAKLLSCWLDIGCYILVFILAESKCESLLCIVLTLVLLNPDIVCFETIVDPDYLASDKVI